ncbi:ribosome maturation factor RimM [Reichenbachiella carrageenanivorans]|uniref:Ribosome maturation factor RimM n=1 Tax=Reichenbachiella carrageenanivorans TaxID=2979869 RepID=A0ABY6D3N6_9BACT|nr:ribosome maturation factor RimM [Reichenbachiella carrageenanivorans]UXX80766.1 ribosome maturation factor RimM [Reichenbachiella carrageenanivorans]
MTVDDCYQIGHVIKTHGLKGDVQLFLDVDNPLEYQNLESVLVQQNSALIPFFIEHIQINSSKAIAKFEEIDDVEEAKALVASPIFLPLNNLPDLADDEYYLHQLVGMDLYDKGKLIGQVKELFEIGPQELISVIHQGKEVLIPLKDEIILKVDIETNRIDADIPDGLIDIYLEEDED